MRHPDASGDTRSNQTRIPCNVVHVGLKAIKLIRRFLIPNRPFRPNQCYRPADVCLS
jgi:hypothetical protein